MPENNNEKKDCSEAVLALILGVSGPYYAAKCDNCGWVGSSEFCIEHRLDDDCEVLCPFCGRGIGDDAPEAKDVAMFLNHAALKIAADKECVQNKLDEALAEITHKNALIEQMRDALNHCKSIFEDYVKIHKAKMPVVTIGPIPPKWGDMQRKIARNQEALDLCNAALSAAERKKYERSTKN